MKKIGLLGGTFDPVHNGHIEIANSFIGSGIIDELWVLLTPFPPHKNQEKHISYEKRLQMLRAGFQSLNCRILTVEKDLPKPSYTYRTIQYLKKEYPSTDFYFCMGEDSLSNFNTWKFYRNILEEANLLVARRPNSNHDDVLPAILKQTSFVDHTPVEISSSQIRERINEPEFIRQNIPKKVASIIEKEELYR